MTSDSVDPVRSEDVAAAFAEIASLVEAGEPVDLEGVCAERPGLRAPLEALVREWQRVRSIAKPRGEPLSERLRREFGPNVDPTIAIEAEPASDGTPWSDLLGRLEEHSPDDTRYRLKGEIARGGMGAILEVWDQDLRRRLAKKVLLPHVGVPAGGEGADAPKGGAQPSKRDLSAAVVGRFLEEAQITAQLDHPGVVPVHELGLDSEGQVYFTMRLVRGRDFRAILKDVSAGRDGWTVTRALGVLARVCEAIGYAHTKGVVHRDLKPANIMVGRFGEVYVMDWGLARVLDREDGRNLRIVDPDEISNLSHVRTDRREGSGSGTTRVDSPLITMDGDVVGTPCFMSPEQARGRLQEIGPHSDVYALGAILYQVLTGHMPYVPPGATVSPHGVWRWVLEGPPTPVVELAPKTPPELVAICEKAMAREIEDRYRDMGEVAEDLRAYLENRVVRAHRTGPAVELAKWVRRNRLVAATAAALIAVLVASGFLLASVERRRSTELLLSATEYRVRDLAEEVDGLFPLHPDTLPRIEDWLERAEVARSAVEQRLGLAAFGATEATRSEHPSLAELRGELELARRTTAELARILASDFADPTGERGELVDLPKHRRESAALRDRLERESAELVSTIELRAALLDADRLADPRDAQEARIAARWRALAEPEVGAIDVVRARAAAIEEARRLSLVDSELAWSAAGRRVASSDEYQEDGPFELEPRFGLVPLGDNEYGYEEFWVVLSGERPEFTGTDRLANPDEAGIVLVLLPGGAFDMGTERDSEENCDNFSRPRHTVRLAPFCLSRYEMTQGQWMRIAGDNPSEYEAGHTDVRLRFSRAHPVENVLWADATRALARVGLELPTEAQWERGAQGAAGGVYGEHDALDEFITEIGSWRGPLARQGSDDLTRYVTHVPAGSHPPNELGLYDMLGNVSEWTRDSFTPEGYPTRMLPGTGEHLPESVRSSRATRGGNYLLGSSEKNACSFRVRFRQPMDPDMGSNTLGLRPALTWSRSADQQ